MKYLILILLLTACGKEEAKTVTAPSCVSDTPMAIVTVSGEACEITDKASKQSGSGCTQMLGGNKYEIYNFTVAVTTGPVIRIYPMKGCQ